jgi:hypothetical protein
MAAFIVPAIVVLAIILASLAGLAARKKSLSKDGAPGRAGTRPPAKGAGKAAGLAGEEELLLMAVLTAAVSAASGMDASSFELRGARLSSPRPAAASSRFARHGINTPAWGHVDRFIRGEQT